MNLTHHTNQNLTMCTLFLCGYRVMRKWALAIFCVATITSKPAQSQDCATNIIPPVLSEATRKGMEEKRIAAKADFEKNPTNADAIIWYGRRTAYLGNYEEAIQIYTNGLKTHPTDARLYRHRGHRYISKRCIDKAIVDFTKAYQLTKGKPDEVEPDGMPNASGIPTRTLQSNIRYHLGLCFYLKGDFGKAATYFQEDAKAAQNPDMYVASANWLYLCYRRSNQTEKAAQLLESIKKDMNLIENYDYQRILLLHKGELQADKLKEEVTQQNSLSNSTMGLGVANYYLINGEKAEAQQMYKLITSGSQWASFAYITAEVELKRLK